MGIHAGVKIMQKRRELRCDVVVAGVGYAGLAATLEALRAGARVITLGKKKLLACNSAMGGGGFALVDTPLQREKGIYDSVELLAEDILKANGRSLPEDIVRAAAREGIGLYDWLIQIGVKFYKVSEFSSHSVPRVHMESGMSGANTSKLLLAAAKERGADVRLGIVAQHLIVNSKNGVEGVQALCEGEEIEIRANKGVVLAAGGFGRNQSMMAQYLPQLSGILSLSGAGSTGDGIRMGEEIGAKLHNMDVAIVTPLGSVKRGATISGVVESMSQGAILVNKRGQRFVDEGKGVYNEVALPVINQPDGVALLVLDEAIKKRNEKLEKFMDEYLRKDLFLYRKTSDELAIAAGLEKEGFRHTIDQYFPSGRLYGTWIKSVLLMTHGGLMVNAMAQVIHREGYPIPHLYAAGDNTPGLGGSGTADHPFPGYLSGGGYLWALTSGRLAGRNAAAD